MRKLVANMEIKNTNTMFFVKKVLKYATIAKNTTASKLPIIKYPITFTTAMTSMMYSTFLSVDRVVALDSADLIPLMNDREMLRKLEFMSVCLYYVFEIYYIYI